MLIYAKAIRNQDPIEEAIFWGIRLTIVSLAINPFLYGLLGGPYRQAYLYILRLLFSKCCHCVEPPPRTGYGMSRTCTHVMNIVIVVVFTCTHT